MQTISRVKLFTMSGQAYWAIVLGFLTGVAARSALDISWPIIAMFAIIGVFFLIYRLTDISKRSLFLILAISSIAFSVGMLRMDSARLLQDPELSSRIGSKVTLQGYVFAEPDVRAKSVRLFVHVRELREEGFTIPVDAKALVLAPSHTEISYGDLIRVTGELELPQSFDTDAGRTFNYPMFLAKDGVLYQVVFSQVETLGENHGSRVKKIALGIKHFYLSGLRSALSEPESGLAGGITVGEKRSIGEDLSKAFQNTSLVHIVVLSGYNMTVVINAAGHVISFAPHSIRFAISGGIVALFVLMTGGAASATRAGAMALTAAYARLSGRTFLALRSLGAISFVMVLINPYTLLFDPGFQLSVIATLGLILFTPIASERLPFIPERFALREIAASTLGTQAAVLPLILYQSGVLSFVSLPANLLALIAVPLAMLFSLVAAIAGTIFGAYAAPFALPAALLLKYLIAVATFFNALPFAHITLPSFRFSVVAIMYVLLGVAYLYFKKK